MKVVLSCDQILQRDLSIEILEIFLGLYKEADLYTFSHVPRAVLGPVETRKIRSSFLGHKWKNWNERGSFLHLMPSAAKNLYVGCQNDLLINVSTGMSHGFRKCKDVRQITYLLDWPWWNKKAKGFRQKLFAGYVESFALKKLDQASEIWCANPALKKYLESKGKKNIKLIPPSIKVEDFPIMEGSAMPRNYWVVEASSVDVETALWLMENQLKGKKIVFVGDDSHLEKLKSRFPEVTFFGDRCNGEMATVLAGCLGYLSFDSRSFPSRTLETLATGRPVLIPESQDYLSLLEGEGVFSFGEGNFTEMKNRLEEMSLNLEAKKLRGRVNKFLPQAFRGSVVRSLPADQ